MPWSNGFMPKGSALFMISLAVVEGKDDLCPNHVTGLDASGTIEIRMIKAILKGDQKLWSIS